MLASLALLRYRFVDKTRREQVTEGKDNRVEAFHVGLRKKHRVHIR